jgi:actin-related protein 10
MTPERAVTADMLSNEIVQDIKTRLLFVSPFKTVRTSHTEETSYEVMYRDTSAATDVEYPFRRADTDEYVKMLIPGWVRERATEVLFDDSQDDEPSIVHCVLDCLVKLPIDVRARLCKTILLVGGCAMLPNFQARFHYDLVRALEQERYEQLGGLGERFAFLDGGERGRVFMPNTRTWIGGSLVGALKASGPEVTKETWNGTVPDWTTSHLEKSVE